MSGFIRGPWCACIFVFLSLTAVSTAAVVPGLQGLGQRATPYAVSADGSTVAGFALEPFRWREDEGLVKISDRHGLAWTLSADGSTVAGDLMDSEGYDAFRWTAEAGLEILERLPGYDSYHTVLGVSADGEVLVGFAVLTPAAFEQAVRWTRSEGIVGLGYLPGAARESSAAHAVSGDGRVIVGKAANSANVLEAFRWTPEGGMVGLGIRPGTQSSQALDISADGLVVLGADVLGTWRWTEAAGIQPLDTNGMFFSASAISGDGSVVVGQTHPSPEGHKAAIWDPVHGLRYLHEVLEDLGVDTTNRQLWGATDVSADGLTIVGQSGRLTGGEGWIARLPEPSSLLLLSMAGVALVGRGSRLTGRRP